MNTIYKCGLVLILVQVWYFGQGFKDSGNQQGLIVVDHKGLPATNPNFDSKETNDPLNQSHHLSFQIPS